MKHPLSGWLLALPLAFAAAPNGTHAQTPPTGAAASTAQEEQRHEGGTVG